MCVTNTTSRRPVTLAAPLNSSSSMISQRLCDSLFSLVQASTASTVPARPEVKPDVPMMVSSAEEEKNRRRRNKRKRKPQKPGKTAKLNDRHFVVHNYHDHAADVDQSEMEADKPRRRGGVSVAFPIKLHAMLDQIERDGLSHVISWQPHGRCFVIHKPELFTNEVMPKYFRQTKLTSFQRQLNLYGFQRLTRGADNTGYYHELFLRNKTFLCKHMQRIKVKGTGFKAASSPEDEPDFYRMPPVIVTPHHSSDDAHSSDDGSVMSESTLTHQPPQPFHPLARPTLPHFSSNPAPLAAAVEPLPMPLAPLQVAFLQSKPEPVASEQPQQPSQVLDEVVDELFLHDSSEEENDTILDFVETWNPESFDGMFDDVEEWYRQSIDDDAELGRLLEKVMAE